MADAKKTSIRSFFKPIPKQTSVKRSFPSKSPYQDVRRGDKSPRISHSNTHAPQTQSGSQDDKQLKSRQAANLIHIRTADSFELSSTKSCSDSDLRDTQEVIDPINTSIKSNHVPSDLQAEQEQTGSFARDVLSSSHRTERNGEAIVTGSDDDSDELLDLDRLLGRKPLTPKPPPRHYQEHNTLTRSGKRQRPNYEDTSVADQVRFNEIIEKAKNDLAKSREQQKALDQVNKFVAESSGLPPIDESQPRYLDTETILSRVGDLDPEKAERFAQAIKRTELTESVRHWSFFSPISSSSRQVQVSLEWPEIHDQPEWSNFQESTGRDLAFLSGAFEQAAADGQLPPEVILWILDQSFTETRLDLRDSYRLVLAHAENCFSGDQILKSAESLLRRFGATDEAMSVSSDPINSQSHYKDRAGPPSLPGKSLHLWLQNMRAPMRIMSSRELVRMLDILFLLTLDSAISNNGLILLELQRTIQQCIEHLAEKPDLAQTLQQSAQRIFSRAGNIHFRLQFLQCLPIGLHSLSVLRRNFARAAFHEDPSWLNSDADLSSLQQLKAVLECSERFKLTRKTDLKAVAAYIECFDLAVSAGVQGDLTDPASVVQFNNVIDELIKVIRVKDASVHRTRADRVLQLEVKDTLETIQQRLSFSVRTERKQRRSMFNQPTLEDMLQK